MTSSNLPYVNDIYRHKDSQGLYVVTGLMKFKDPVTREWIGSVSYALKSEIPDSDVYVRTLEDFLNRFEPLNEHLQLSQPPQVGGRDSLHRLFEMQNDLNNAVLSKKCIMNLDGSTLCMEDFYNEILHNPNLGPNTLVNEWLKKFSWALGDEVRELNEELLQKWWSKDSLNMQNIKVEIIDILHFWISLCQVAGMTPDDVMRIYIQKNEVNLKRQENDYSKSNKNESDNLNII